jgi:hypothetical protein
VRLENLKLNFEFGSNLPTHQDANALPIHRLWPVRSIWLPFPPCRGNRLGVKGWAAMSDALEAITSLTCLNGCDQYAAIRAGGVTEMRLGGTELGVWAARFLERSASTLTSLDIRCCAVVGCHGVGRVPHAKLNFSQAPMAQRGVWQHG